LKTMLVPRDIKLFLDGYPGYSGDPNATDNLDFYSNKLRCQPDDLLIDEIHEKWFGAYETLEYRHGFIQWLFPIQEHGLNFESQPLQPQEIVTMKSPPVIIARILESYQLMLDFYGMRLVSAESGLLERVQPLSKCGTRYRNLTRSSHNYLRISRILKCLSEFGLEHLNAGFLLHVLSEQSESDQLNSPRLRSSMDRWWANCIRNGEEREWIGGIIAKVRAGKYLFTREMYEEVIERRVETGSLKVSS